MKKDMFGDDVESQASQNDFAKMFEASVGNTQKSSHSNGDRVQAEIMTIGRDNTFVIFDGREGSVPTHELKNAEGALELRVGDTVELFITKLREDIVELSAKPSHKAMAETLEDAFDFESPVEGVVTEVVNGGYRVKVMHKLAFCPLSQMDSKSNAEPASYVGRKFEFIITKFEEGGRNIVLSRRRMLEREALESQGQFVEKHKIGDELTGRVTRLEQFGAFVEIGTGVEGLVHISEIGWSRVAHPSEVLNPGDPVQVKILKIEEDDRGRLKISLSRKQAEANPWEKLDFHVGDVVEATLRDKAHFGYLMELKPGIVGLLPKSVLKEAPTDLGVEKKNPGEKFKVQIMRVDQVEHKIALTFPKDQEDDSWRQTVSQAPKASFGTLGDQLQGLFKKK